MLESAFQAKVIQRIQEMYPGAVPLKTDPNYIQGFPDWLILEGPNWAALEIKVREKYQPNQEYYINLLDDMSFARFLKPENEERIYDELQQTFSSFGTARLLKR